MVAVLRALGSLWSVTLEPLAMAELALSIEVDDLGIAAGLQDRIAQTHAGLTFMDFGAPGATTVGELDTARLPPLLVAWRPESGGHSGDVHAPLRDRHAEGEPVVLEAMRALTCRAHGAEHAIRNGDHATLCASVDASFDARRSMLALDPRHVEMIELRAPPELPPTTRARAGRSSPSVETTKPARARVQARARPVRPAARCSSYAPRCM